MSVEKRIAECIDDNDIYKFLPDLDKLAGKNPNKADRIISKFLTEKKRRYFQFDRNTIFQLKTAIRDRRYPNLRIHIEENGNVFISASQDEELVYIRKSNRKKAIVASFIVIAIAVAAFFVYTNFIQDKELESMEINCELSAYSSAYNDVYVSFTPENASDKNVVWSVDNDKVKLFPDGSKLRYAIDPSVKSGTKIAFTAVNEKYSVETTQYVTVINDISVDATVPNNVGVGDYFTFSNSSNSPLNPHITWTCQDSNVVLTELGSDVNVSILNSGSIGDTYTILGTIDGTDITKSFDLAVTYNVAISLDYDCPFKDQILGSNSSIIVTGQEFTITPTLKSMSEKIVWDVSYSGISYTEDGKILKCKVDSVDNSQIVKITGSIYGTEATSTIVLDLREGTIVTNPDELSEMKGDGRYYVANDIDLKDYSWVPYEFKGELIGVGAIKNLSINKVDRFSSSSKRSGELCFGLFTKNSGNIHDISIQGANVKVAPNNLCDETTIYAGVITGANTGTIYNCTVSNSSIEVYSSNIKTAWLSKYTSIPAVASSKSGDWYKYASLNFTGMKVNDGWASNKNMIIYVGGIVGTSSDKIDSCTTNDTNIYGEIINFNANGGTFSAYVGAIAGSSVVMNSHSVKNSVTGVITLHDSGDGTGGGLGYSGDYSPTARGYIGKISGEGAVTSCSESSEITTKKEAFAPVYVLLKGSSYDSNKGKTSNIVWSENK